MSVDIDLVPELDSKVEKMPEMVAPSVAAAEQIADALRASAPEVSGDYKGGITVQKTKRGARVRAGSRHSAALEFGAPSRGIRARGLLRNAAAGLGFTFQKRRR